MRVRWVGVRALVAVLFQTTVLLGSSPAARAADGPCLDEARRRIAPGKTIGIERVDGGKVTGRLVSIDVDRVMLTIARQVQGSIDSAAHPLVGI